LKLIAPKYIFTGDEILEEMAVAFEKQIIAIDSFDNLRERFPDSEVLEVRENTFLMAGLINSHVHLEYSHHTTEYDYGTYMGWLKSIIRNFQNLAQSVSTEKIERAIQDMLESGTTYIGAISSMGLDFETLKSSPIRKTVFNEVIASQPHQVDDLYKLWLQRVESCEELRDERLTPAVAIHSPFSVHPVVIKRVVKMAKERGYQVSSHFMESKAEREWLDSESGEFRDFYLENYGVAKRFTTAEEFLASFRGVPTLFTHGVYLHSDEVEAMSQYGHGVSHCPVSNRLLGGDRLNIENLDQKGVSWNISTDGFSSNISLNMFDEMKTALYLHNSHNIEEFALELLKASTVVPAEQLQLNSGKIEAGKDSDMILIDLGNFEFDSKEKIPLHIILRGLQVYQTIIFGRTEFQSLKTT
jgi:cytosine/adenosine deaminase-related metal-dependent hydrolase